MLTSYNGTAITYDAIGTPLKWRNATAIEWQGRNLTLFSNSNGEIYNYTYNADGIRTQKNVFNANGDFTGSTEYIYDGTKLIAESRSGDWLYYFYDANGAVTGMSYNGTLYYYRKNLQGDITGIYNAYGTLVVEYEYTPYGAILSTTGSMASTIGSVNPFRYRGYYYDSETGFYYLITRYYDPVVGRFLNADALVSTGQGVLGNNMFAYCLNNPINGADAFGLCSTASGIKSCLQGGCDCSHNHCTAEYIIMKHFVEPNTQWIEIQDYIREHNRTMLSSVVFELRFDAIMFLAKSYDAGHTLFVTWGSRDEDPDFTYGPHIYGWAFDFQFWDEMYYDDITSGDFNAEYFHNNVIYQTYNVDDPRWDIVGPIGESCGLVWGRTLCQIGAFLIDDDPCHFQISGFWILREQLYGIGNWRNIKV